MARIIINSYPPLTSLDEMDRIEGKFVQFNWQGNDFLLFAARDEHRFHNQMLARFFTEHDIPHQWRDEQTLEFDTEQVKVAGGGRFRFDRRQALLELWDNSQAYGRFDETGLAGKIRTSGHAFGSGKIRIC